MAPERRRTSGHRSRIERSLSLTIDSKDVKTRAEYGAHLFNMFPQQPRQISFEGFAEQMERFGFVNPDELTATFDRFASGNGTMRFRDFAASLLPADKRPGQSSVVPSCDRLDLDLGSTMQSLRSRSSLGSTKHSLRSSSSCSGRTAGKATKLKRRCAKSAGFGRRGTYVTNPSVLDMEKSKTQLAPAEALFRTAASHQYETTNMLYNRHWRDEPPATHSNARAPQPTLWRLATGIADPPIGKSEAPRINTWITSSEFMPPPLQQPPHRSPKHRSQDQELYKSKYMLDTEKMAGRIKGRQSVVTKAAQADLPARTQKLRNMINRTYNLQQTGSPLIGAPPSQSGVSMISMGIQPTKGFSITQYAQHVSQQAK